MSNKIDRLVDSNIKQMKGENYYRFVDWDVVRETAQMNELSKKLKQYNVLDLQKNGGDKQLKVKHDHDSKKAHDGYQALNDSGSKDDLKVKRSGTEELNLKIDGLKPITGLGDEDSKES